MFPPRLKLNTQSANASYEVSPLLGEQQTPALLSARQFTGPDKHSPDSWRGHSAWPGASALSQLLRSQHRSYSSRPSPAETRAWTSLPMLWACQLCPHATEWPLSGCCPLHPLSRGPPAHFHLSPLFLLFTATESIRPFPRLPPAKREAEGGAVSWVWGIDSRGRLHKQLEPGSARGSPRV